MSLRCCSWSVFRCSVFDVRGLSLVARGLLRVAFFGDVFDVRCELFVVRC